MAFEDKGIYVREYEKFLEDEAGDVAVRVNLGDSRLKTDDFLFEVSRGTVPGFSTREVFGRNPNIGLADPFETIWSEGGVYVFPTSAATVDIVSTNANDTAAGTGAREVTIEYLDANYDTGVESVTLNGTTPVTTVASILRINNMAATDVGSSGTSVGIIRASQGANILARLDPLFNNTLQAIYTVPNNTNAYVVSATSQITIGNRGTGYKSGEVVLATGIQGSPFIASVIASLQTDGSSSFSIDIGAPLKFGPETDLTAFFVPQHDGTAVSLSSTLILEDIS